MNLNFFIVVRLLHCWLLGHFTVSTRFCNTVPESCAPVSGLALSWTAFFYPPFTGTTMCWVISVSSNVTSKRQKLLHGMLFNEQRKALAIASGERPCWMLPLERCYDLQVDEGRPSFPLPVASTWLQWLRVFRLLKILNHCGLKGRGDESTSLTVSWRIK